MAANPRRHEKRIGPSDANRILAEWPRRAVLDELHGGPLASVELAGRLAERHDAPALANDRDIHIALYHVHLPMLQEYDAVTVIHGQYRRGPTAGLLEGYR